MKIIQASNPIWANAEKTAINLMVVVDAFPDQQLPFTAMPTDTEAHGRELFAEAQAGKFGPVADFVPYVKPVEQIEAEARQQRNQLLMESDSFVLPDRWAALTSAQQENWAQYRQALRDVPEQSGFPTDIQWPIKPN